MISDGDGEEARTFWK